MSLPPAQDPDDSQLVHACRRGERGAWEQLVRRYERLIFTIPRRARLDPEDAADVFQTVFQRLHQHLDNLAQPERLHAWLVTTAKRETLRRLRERSRAVSIDGTADDERAPESVDPDPLPDAIIERLQVHHRLRTALQTLPEPCRSLLTLLFCDDEPPTYSQIAVQLGVPEGSIGPTRSRCLAKLRKLIASMP